MEGERGTSCRGPTWSLDRSRRVEVNDTKERLWDVLKNLGCSGAAVFDPAGGERLKVGDVESIRSTGLFGSLFGGPAQLQRLRESLNGQLLPRIWSQAPVKCFVSILPDGGLYAVFTTMPLDPSGVYELSLKVAKAVESILAGTTSS